MNSNQLGFKRVPLRSTPDPFSDRGICIGIWILTLFLYLALGFSLYIIWLKTNPG